MEEQTRDIPLDKLRPPKVPLRPLNTQSVEFLELRDSIRDKGLIDPITVRPIRGGYFEIVVGFYRSAACESLGHTTIKCLVKNLTDAEVLEYQIAENAIKVPTKPVEYAKHLKRLQKAYPNLTVPEIAKSVGKSVHWVYSQLLLVRLIDHAQLAVDRGEMPMSNAYMLAKIPRQYQRGFLIQAKTFSAQEFNTLASAFIRSVMETRRTGQLHKHFLKDFEAQPYLRPLRDVLTEVATNREGNKQVEKRIKGGPSNRALGAQRRAALEGWKAALEWVMHIDDDSVEKQKKAHIEKQRQQEIERELYVNDIDSEVPDDNENSISVSNSDSQL